MEKNKALPTLVKLTEILDFSSQHLLRDLEDELAQDYVVSCVLCGGADIKKYLMLTSLPFHFSKGLPKVQLEDLWPVACEECQSVVYRHTMPTGNMHPRYIVVGDAPGVGDGALIDRFDRKWVYGPSSHLLRKALDKFGIYEECWFTNLLKCSTPENRPSSQEEVKTCSKYLLNEIKLLKPKRAIILGNHAWEMCPDLGIPKVKVYHPSYFVRKGGDWKQYAKHVKEVIVCKE
jgi:hypothetical protein